MLPGQFSSIRASWQPKTESGIRYRLIGLWPIYRRNAPASDLERNALESLRKNPDLRSPESCSGANNYFRPIYPDLASHGPVSTATTVICSAETGL